jgi:hypothetical protein
MKAKNYVMVLSIMLLCLSVSVGCSGKADEAPPDEAMAAGLTKEDFPTHAYDRFKGMDGNVELTEDQFKGRNTWLMWTGGNEAGWTYFADHGGGVIDLLKILDNRHVKRSERLQQLGLINEPGFAAPTGPDEFGLWLDQRDAPEPEHLPNPRIYGRASGSIGMRIFPNPNFDDEAARKWDPDRYMTDVSYYKDPNLVRPYRVGMSCAACHVAFHPLFPPEDPLEPEWTNLSSNIGNQYFRAQGIFVYDLEEDDILWQLLDTSRPGALDTSLIATDGNNNPNTMNSVFDVPARVAISQKINTETLSEAGCNQPILPILSHPPDCPERNVPRVLANGEDGIGLRGALTRVYINIGEYHQEWIRDMNLVAGVNKQKPFSIKQAQQKSVYWQVTDFRMINLANYFLATTGPMHLKDATWTDSAGNEHSGSEFVDDGLAEQGKLVFARKCVFCHSSKQPEELGFWANPTDYEKWSQDETYLTRAREIVLDPDFLKDNYMSTDQRYPITLIGTNADRALADNATHGRVWAQFSSETYKEQPSVGEIVYRHPYQDEYRTFQMPPGGPGRYRPLTLIGIWATAPLLHNNTVGDYPAGNDPRQYELVDVSVPGRLAVFNDSIEKMLWPEKRDGVDSIYLTTADSYVKLPYVVLEDFAKRMLGINLGPVLWGIPVLIVAIGVALFLLGCKIKGRRTFKKVSRGILCVVGPLLVLVAIVVVLFVSFPIYNNGIKLGPIPKGTPVNLIFNGINSPPYATQRPDKLKIMLAVGWDMLKVFRRELPSLDHPDVPNLVPNLLKINKSPDFVQDRGHLFGTELSDDDKRALIEFLKTF